ncbi:isochorismate synthase [Haloechinothrix alba]|uniref:isochorismate synthase n=1 Tax=Haloechinothrix alba TaxID=664784 RepID=A0A238XFQ2_9PSEU|nr:isochorismate synthase [Haloechinothrix alba]SNR57144.1 isochorismate synthase [Haloechinothrix alba]
MTVAGRGAGARADQRADPAELLAAYRRGDFFLSTAERSILARGADTVLDGDDIDGLDTRLSQALTGAAHPVAVGVLPFATGATGATGAAGGEPGEERAVARFVLPRELWTAEPAHGAAAQRATRGVPVPAEVTPFPAPEGHRAAVQRALAALDESDLRKVVLARALDISFTAEVDPACLLHNLVRDNTGGYTYAVELPRAAAGSPGPPGQRSLVGASPELLVRRSGTLVSAHPHAGSAPRSSDADVDRRNAEALLGSAKDHAEHAMVTEAVVAALRPLCRRIDVPPEPSLMSTSTMWHLGTAITGELRDEGISALRLAAALHPTPAVCGTPTPAARLLVGELEPFERDYYAGAVGWVDTTGDGEWAVAIRCAQVAERSLRLYSGGGIVAGSDPDAELAETSAKFQTLLRAMGLDLNL